MRQPLRVFVTNFNARFTGVSATAAGVAAVQSRMLDLTLVGEPLPGCPEPVSLLEALRQTRRFARHRHVLWHVRRNSEMLAALAARHILRLPVKIVFTSAAQRFHSWFPRQLIARMDAVIATSPKSAQFVPNACAVIPHGVDGSRFFPSADRDADWKSLGYGGARGIAAVGRIRPEKGTDLFVSAMISCLPKFPNATALIVGRAAPEHSAFADALKRQVKDAGLAARILFPGEVPPDEMPALYRSLSLLVAVPRYEGYGMTALEAMASGVPVIASRTGHFAEFCKHGGGIILDSSDADTVSAAVGTLLSDGARQERMSKAARRTAVENHGIAAEADAVNAVYAQLLIKTAE